MSSHTRRPGIRAPELSGRDWHNTGGRSLHLADLEGRVVLLHFWTSCSTRSITVLDHLPPVRERFTDAFIVVSVHSPKFPHQTEPATVADAVERHGVEHPVLDDVRLETWSAYSVTAWPTFVLVDPEGYLVRHMAGTSHGPRLARVVDDVVSHHRERGTLKPRAESFAPKPRAPTPLRFPGKALAMPDDRTLAHPSWRGSVLTSDTVHGQLVVLAEDLETEVGRIGTGERGLADGAPGTARFGGPQGLALLPAPVASAVGYDVVVADTGSHALRGVNLSDGTVQTLAARRDVPAPWDVAWFDGYVAVAMADAHQLWAFVPAPEPEAERVSVLAGTGTEGLMDGAAARAWFAQPSGLAVGADGETLWVADAQSSAVRWLRRSLVGGYEVGTGVGQGLFDSGFRDGRRDEAQLQHPHGVTALDDGSIAVADTYNGAVRRFDPQSGEVTTLFTSLREPTDLIAVDHSLIVVESAAHRLVRVPVSPGAGRRVSAPPLPTSHPALEIAPGTVRVEVRFVPPSGHRLDDRAGAPTWLTAVMEPSDLLMTGHGAGPGLHRDLLVADPADGGHDRGVLHVAVHASTHPQEEGETEDPHHYAHDWGLPVRVTAGGATRIVLDLGHP